MKFSYISRLLISNIKINRTQRLVHVIVLEKSAETRRKTQQQSKENCYFCKEMKRRNLGVYIRSKSRSDSCHEGIHEEEEESDTTYGEKKTADASQNKSAKSHNTEKQKS